MEALEKLSAVKEDLMRLLCADLRFTLSKDFHLVHWLDQISDLVLLKVGTVRIEVVIFNLGQDPKVSREIGEVFFVTSD